MRKKSSKNVRKCNNINKIIQQQRIVFNLPSGTIKDGVDDLPTVQSYA